MDTRNWKCLFGLHQWEVCADVIERKHFECQSSKRPYKITLVHRLKCKFCGDMKAVEL